MAPRQPLDASEFPPHLTKENLRPLRSLYHIPTEFKIYPAKSSFRAHHDPNKKGEKTRLVIYVDQLEGGLRFPLDPIVIRFFQAYAIVPGQLHPNGYRFLTAFCELIRSQGHEPSVFMNRYF